MSEAERQAMERKLCNLRRDTNRDRYAIHEYKSLLLDILDLIDTEETLENVKYSLEAFEIEVMEGNPHNLLEWRASQLAKEKGKGAEFFQETSKEN